MENAAGLPLAKNYITTHSPNGKAIFLPESEISSTPTYKGINNTKSLYADLHFSPSVPAVLDQESSGNDITASVSFIADNVIPTSVPGAGVVFRRTDTPPGGVSPMHRTVTVDYGIILSGRIDFVLESGETRSLKAGDTLVQRATMHQWRNPSETEWCRMVFVMLPSEALVFDGKKLEQEFRIPGAPAK
jgi:quercetin dioxygenase-like cupin family protein